MAQTRTFLLKMLVYSISLPRAFTLKYHFYENGYDSDISISVIQKQYIFRSISTFIGESISFYECAWAVDRTWTSALVKREICLIFVECIRFFLRVAEAMIFKERWIFHKNAYKTKIDGKPKKSIPITFSSRCYGKTLVITLM